MHQLLQYTWTSSFNNDGTRKFRDITRDYQNEVSNEVTNETTENNSVEDETTDDTESEEVETTEVGLYVDGTSMMTTSFTEIIDNGVMSLSLGSSSSDDQTKITYISSRKFSGNIRKRGHASTIFSNRKCIYFLHPIEQSTINILIGIGLCIAVVMLIVAIVKYRVKGVIISVCMVGFIALYLLILRYTNVVITLEGIFSIALVFVINYILNIMIL